MKVASKRGRVFLEGGEALRCPHCGFEGGIHQGGLIVWKRKQEDGEAEAHMVIPMRSPKLSNPSSRRHGISIEFECESCSHLSVLGIAQHKGQTLVYWQ